MIKLAAVGKFLDQPRLVGKISKTVPALLVTGGAIMTAKHAKQASKDERKKVITRDVCTLTGAIGSALAFKKIDSLIDVSKKVDFKKIAKNNTEYVNDFLKENKVSKKVTNILEKSKEKILNLSEVNEMLKEVKTKKNGKDFIQKLIPDPQNVTSKEIVGEIGRLSLMGLVPVVGGLAGGITGDKLTDKNWKEKVPNKIKEGTFQYLANIFLCNIGAAAALGGLEKAKITSKSARAVGMIAGIMATGVIGGSAIANKISQKVIDPMINKFTKKSNKTDANNKSLYSERKPEALDLCMHTDDIATVAVLSGLKWIEPALPILYSVSGYKTGIGYRSEDKHSHKHNQHHNHRMNNVELKNDMNHSHIDSFKGLSFNDFSKKVKRS